MGALAFAETAVTIPELVNPLGYGPGIAYEGAGAPRVLFTVDSRGAASRLAYLEPATRRVVIGPSVLGELRDAQRSRDGRQVWILCTYGLYRASASDLAITSRIKVPKHLHRLTPFAEGGAIALAQPDRIRTPVVLESAPTKTVAITAPTPDIGFDEGQTSWLLSFWAGEAREFGRDLRPTGRRRGLPRGVTALRQGDDIYFVSAVRRQHPGVSPEHDAPWVVPEDELCVFSLSGWRILRHRRIAGVQRTIGIDGRGRILLEGGDKLTAGPTTVVAVDPDSLETLGTHRFAERAESVSLAGPSAIAYRVRAPRINVVQWS